MFLRRNFRWHFKPIRENFRFFPKYNDIYLLRRMTSEIFIAFGQKKLDPHHPDMKIREKKSYAKLKNFRQLYIPVGDLFTIFSKLAKCFLPNCITSEIFSYFKRTNFYFFEGVDVRRTNFKWRFKPIGEIFRFFPKYNDIYLLRLMSSEIFSRFRENFWLLLLLRSAIKFQGASQSGGIQS